MLGDRWGARAPGNISRPSVIDRHAGLIQACADFVAWLTATTIATLERYDLVASDVAWPEILLAGTCIGVSAVAFGAVLGLYAGRWQFGSFEEVSAVAVVVLVIGSLTLFVSQVIVGGVVPTGAAISGPAFALIMMGGTRYVWRLLVDRRLRPSDGSAKRLLVFGAGRAGVQIVNSLVANPRSAFVPVAILDDDPAKRRRKVKGVPVVGNRYQMIAAAEAYRAEAVLFAVPSASANVVQSIVKLAEQAGLTVSILPSVQELVAGRVSVADIRPVTEADLLGRKAIDTDLASIAGYISGRRVLVTGAGGSIGSELSRQLSRFEPSRLVMLDRDESALHAVQLSIEGQALLQSDSIVVADIRDRERLSEVFGVHKPEVVFHAAALKHLPLLEQHPSEAVKTNVMGTLHLLEVAADAGVERFVNISTDKAADPSSVLGYSKRIAERLTANSALQIGRPFLSVRFGNVIGSRGSVVPTFRSQIKAGGPVTVTDPDVTRYFMTVEEAVQLVIQAGAIGEPGEVLILDMGKPVKVADVARLMIAASGREVDIVFTGLRPGEKMHEDLVAGNETDHRPRHPLIIHAPVPPLNCGAVRNLALRADDLITELSLISSLDCDMPSSAATVPPVDVLS